jgi:RNA polymerase sigma-70 factor (ECF subfamily)
MIHQTKLADEIRNGSEEALFSLMTFYYNDLFKYGLKFTADANLTKDIIQQFILHIWSGRTKFQVVDNIERYLLVAFKRFIIQELRKNSRYNSMYTTSDGGLQYLDEQPMISFQQNELLSNTLLKAIETLPNRYKELLKMRYYEQMSFDDIAKKTSLSVRTVYNCLHEALKKLRSHELLKNIYKHVYN